ncbi:MAG: hypothetical protein RML46_06540 [Anaerolineae bacterium]|nr:hypothetical protein [Anaerolineae bacterium]
MKRASLKHALDLFLKLHRKVLGGRLPAAARLAILDGQVCGLVLWDAVYLLYYWAAHPPHPFPSSGLSNNLSAPHPLWTHAFSPDPLRTFPLDRTVQAYCDGSRIVLSAELSSSKQARTGRPGAPAQIILDPIKGDIEVFRIPRGQPQDLAHFPSDPSRWAQKGLKMIDPDEPDLAPLILLPSLPPLTDRPVLVAMGAAHAYVQIVDSAQVAEPLALPPSIVEVLAHLDPEGATISSYPSGGLVLSSPHMFFVAPSEGRKRKVYFLSDIFNRAQSGASARAVLPPQDLLDHLYPHMQVLSRTKDDAAIHIALSNLGIKSMSPHSSYSAYHPSVQSSVIPQHQEGSADILLLRPMFRRLYTFIEWAAREDFPHIEIAIVLMSEVSDARAIYASCPPMWFIAMGAVHPHRSPSRHPQQGGKADRSPFDRDIS